MITSTPAEKISSASFWGDAGAAGGILSIGDDEADVVFPAQLRHQFADRPASGLPHDVSNEQEFHPGTVITGGQ